MEDKQEIGTPAWQRQTAVKTWICNLLQGKYVTRDGAEPNYLQLGRQKIGRVNLIGVIVGKEEHDSSHKAITIDDGSGRIIVRSFDNSASLAEHQVGGIINLIGRPRSFGAEVYLVPEIIKKVDNPLWIELRKAELSTVRKAADAESIHGAYPLSSPPTGGLVLEEELISSAPRTGMSLAKENEREFEEAVYQQAGMKPKKGSGKTDVVTIIKSLDSGSGADMADVIKKIGGDSGCVEKELQELILNGDIFEVRPGRLKVLE
ncbi:hypothetical protein HYU19_03195 [Candidatus Woesearchaeota archaeon]|nr:hypothetical protein [Candidatus Woesearchaeota archaeon]